MILTINGLPMSGKDQFMEYCKEYSTDVPVHIISTVDWIKQVAAWSFDWDGNKTPEARKFLSELKRITKEWCDLPYKKTCEFINEKVAENDKCIIFVVSREPEEIERFEWDYGAISILMDREKCLKDKQSNDSDKRVFEHVYDYVIDNNGTLEDLKETANKFMSTIIVLND